MTNDLLFALKRDHDIEANEAFRIVAHPDWLNSGRVHDWRNYIPIEVTQIWEELTLSSQLAILLVAQKAADSEQWEL